MYNPSKNKPPFMGVFLFLLYPKLLYIYCSINYYNK
jgi:hypothetical protein